MGRFNTKLDRTLRWTYSHFKSSSTNREQINAHANVSKAAWAEAGKPRVGALDQPAAITGLLTASASASQSKRPHVRRM
jgi:hypothetical protein